MKPPLWYAALPTGPVAHLEHRSQLEKTAKPWCGDQYAWKPPLVLPAPAGGSKSRDRDRDSSRWRADGEEVAEAERAVTARAAAGACRSMQCWRGIDKIDR